MIALMVIIVLKLISFGHIAEPEVFVIPPMPQYSADLLFEVCLCDKCCHDKAVEEFTDEFTKLFDSYETKRASNGALLIRRGNSGRYSFTKKGN